MKTLLRRFTKNLSTLLAAFFMALAVWVMAVNSTDPVEKRAFLQPIPIEIQGLDPTLIINSSLPKNISLSLSAPGSVWKNIDDTPQPVHAILDLSGLKEGQHDVPIEVKISAHPVKVENISPDILTLNLEPLYSQSFPIKLIQPSPPAIGFEAGEAQLSQTHVIVSGATTQVEKIKEVQAVLDVSQASADIHRTVSLQAVDEQGLPLDGLIFKPEKITVDLKISQRSGYRNLAVKLVPNGQIASDYRLTNISVWPPTVIVFSNDTLLINSLPGYIETQPVDISNLNANFTSSVPLNLPKGITVVGDPMVQVNLTIAPIQGSITLNSVPVETIGATPDLVMKISPDKVDVILSGPLPLLDQLKRDNVHIILDLTDLQAGTYQLTPQAEFNMAEIKVDSILPNSIQVILSLPATATPRGSP